MIIYIGNKWFDTDKLTEIETEDQFHQLFVTEKGTLIGRSSVVSGLESPWHIVDKDSDRYKYAEKYINPNPENEL